MTGPSENRSLGRLRTRALLVGIAATVLCGIGAFFNPAAVLRAYLVAFLFCLGVAHGCMAILMLFHLTGGAWGVVLRRILEAGMATMPLLALFFVPIAAGASQLYLWAQPDTVAAYPGLQAKQAYLNVPFFLQRAVIYFVSWIGLALALQRWSRQQDKSAEGGLAQRMAGASAGGLIVYGVTITFASVDWVMSLQPAFRSTIFGPLFASGELVSGLAFALLVLAWLVRQPPLSEIISEDVLGDLGNLLFTFVILWAYLEFFQFMLVWMANLPYDVIWYLPRSQHGWQYVAGALFLLHFAVPFFLLLSRAVKRDARTLGGIAGLVLFMHLVFLNYQVLPAFDDVAPIDHWLDVVAPLGVGGLWLAFFLRQLQRLPLLARNDPQRENALSLRHRTVHELREGAVPHG